MTLKELNTYRYLQKEIEHLEGALSNEIVMDSVKGSMHEYPYIMSVRKITGYTKKGEKLPAFVKKHLSRLVTHIMSYRNI